MTKRGKNHKRQQKVQEASSSQQQGQPSVSQQQQPAAPQQQQPAAPQQQQPAAPQQQQPFVSQQQGPPTVWRQQRPSVPQQQRPSVPQQQRPSVPQQQQPAAPQQQQPAAPQQQQPFVSQQQGPPTVWRQQRPSVPQQQRPSVPQQQRPSVSQQQRPSAPQQQQPSTSPAVQDVTVKQFQDISLRPKDKTERSILLSSMQKMYMDLIPRRKSATGGTLGRKIKVETNLFQIIFKPNFKTNIIHYDVVISPNSPTFLFRKIFEEFKRKHFPNRNPAFDGRKNAYSGNELPFGDCSVEDDIKLLDPERQQERVWKVYMQKVAVLDLSWLKNLNTDEAEEKQLKDLKVLEIIFRHGPACYYTSVGRSLFTPPQPGKVVNMPDGMDLWVGVFQSVLVGKKIYLNVDVVHKEFPREQSVIDLMKDLCTSPRGPPLTAIRPEDVQRNKEKINKFLKGLKVQYELPGQPTTKRTYRVNELVESPNRNKFRLENDTLCTVEQYFLQNKKYRIRFPELPCIWVGSRNNNIYLPAELCTIVGGQVTKKSPSADLVKYAAIDTRRRKEKIISGFSNMKLNQQPTLMNEFNISVQGEFEKVPARILSPPMLKYHEKEVNVVKGTWRVEKFLKPCDLADNSWTILNLDRKLLDRDLYRLQSSLQDGGASVNMTIGKALTPFVNLPIQRNISNIVSYFQEKKKQQLRLVVVVIPVLDNVYSLVKQISELKVTGGIVTQCLKSSTLGKLSPSTVTNILLKINSKLNGVNHTFAPTYRPRCLNVPCMLVGADVTHPPSDSTNIPSIAAVAASHEPNAFQYNIELRLQSPREEIIQKLEEMMRLQLIYFYKKTGYKPAKIIFYRDGVSEGQLTQVMHFELSAIKRAIAKLQGSSGETIPITFLVVQKRHHVRLFPTDKNCDTKNFNVLAGTIVDTEITHPTHIDFYLVSHASIQGTARPTKYRCICNENDMSEDEIEQLTYYLCHIFARCTRSVSYPAPTYYAHLAAFRARALIQDVPLNMHNLEEAQRTNMNLQMNAHSPMFFV